MRNDMSHPRPANRSKRAARRVAAAILGALALAGMALAAVPSGAPPIGDAARGKALFVKNGCYACHGYDGQGSIYTGLRIAPSPLPWQAIAAFIRNPPGMKRPYSNWPNFVMPPFTAQMVSDRDVRDIYAYLSSVPGPAALKSIPTFKKPRK